MEATALPRADTRYPTLPTGTPTTTSVPKTFIARPTATSTRTVGLPTFRTILPIPLIRRGFRLYQARHFRQRRCPASATDRCRRASTRAEFRFFSATERCVAYRKVCPPPRGTPPSRPQQG